MRTPKLFARLSRNEGRVRYPDEWDEHSPIDRADMLTDWILALDRARVQAVLEIGTKQEQERLGYFIHDTRLPVSECKPHEARSH